jgi:hypothetical protein
VPQSEALNKNTTMLLTLIIKKTIISVISIYLFHVTCTLSGCLV